LKKVLIFLYCFKVVVSCGVVVVGSGGFVVNILCGIFCLRPWTKRVLDSPFFLVIFTLILSLDCLFDSFCTWLVGFFLLILILPISVFSFSIWKLLTIKSCYHRKINDDFHVQVCCGCICSLLLLLFFPSQTITFLCLCRFPHDSNNLRKLNVVWSLFLLFCASTTFVNLTHKRCG